MIREDYVSFEVAKLLEEKGFEGDINAYYHIWDNGNNVWSVQEFNHSEAPHLYIPAPTHQIAMKWLREVCKLSIEPYSIAIEENCIWYAYAICNCKTGLEIFAERWDGKNPFASYEKAVEAALKYSLENLI